ncbi:hypothetical protein M9H77_02441 [Catharanthus roseus]|uniref:Uncharacterized protein n=1 Tax=Catharanthus roseus TaxID=4058 RepID=A0ACC0C8E0_CATRO|nr:hypothetical protein M9H77_02441 [Catharanthus roseus]
MASIANRNSSLGHSSDEKLIQVPDSTTASPSPFQTSMSTPTITTSGTTTTLSTSIGIPSSSTNAAFAFSIDINKLITKADLSTIFDLKSSFCDFDSIFQLVLLEESEFQSSLFLFLN